MNKFSVVLFLMVLFFQFSFSADSEKVVYLTSLEWPPYTGEKISSQGMSSLIISSAFKQEGYEVRIDFFPWQRAVNTAKTDDKYVGYFPEYYSKDIEADFVFSNPIGDSPLGFLERKDTPLKWSTVKDLKTYRIGVVNGYVNTEEFDKLIESKEIKSEAANDDLTNIRKVNAKRIDGAVIDQNVLDYFLKSDISIAKFKKDLQFNKTLLENKKIYVCFKKSEAGDKYLKILNNGLKKVDIDKLAKEYMALIGNAKK